MAGAEEQQFTTGYFDNPIPIVVSCVSTFVDEFYHRILDDDQGFNYTKLSGETRDALNTYMYLQPINVVHIFGCAVMLTVLRYILDFLIFKRVPIWLENNKENALKMPESLWKGFTYSVTWAWSIWIIYNRPELFFNPESHWTNWKAGLHITGDIYWLYIVQMGFYLHCIYATLILETKRKDFVVMMIHHVLTLSLLLFSFSIRFHKVGLLVLFLHDIGDIMLEVSKVVVYCRYRGKVERRFVEQLANLLFILFTFQWVFFRLYWFVTKVTYSTAHISMLIQPAGPFYIMFNVMLGVLYIMQWYWFAFIVALILRVMVGGKVEDIREEDEDDNHSSEKKNKKETTNGGSGGPNNTSNVSPGKARKRKPKAETN